MDPEPVDLDFSESEIRRYSRHILLAELGGIGQAKLRTARVLVIGAGGLGSPVALYLAAAGVGCIGLVDDDDVELSNLQRQIAHTTATLGQAKVASARSAMLAINPDIQVRTHPCRLDAARAPALLAQYDLVCDGSDNFATRYLVADACVLLRRTLISASVLRFEGQLATFRPHLGGPCYRCLFPQPPATESVPNCAEAGVLGTVTGVMGSLQATEAVKEITGIGDSLAGRLLLWDALAMRFTTIRVAADPDCALCGAAPRIRDLSAHAL
ncbi:HesA/MoeB/ThiF family protein [Lichenicoccus sp.]|uniref:HesA/MoeB/ThiF family protein n=1 Tax=Lichenicoccus sp. TaxID=2781899 RepID=UPI003D0D5DEC